MADVTAIERIERALSRIETATNHRARESAALVKRHALLRARMSEAISALDAMIADAKVSQEGDD